MARSALSDSQRVADLLLAQQGSSLKEWLAAQRGGGATYEEIGRQLWAITDGEVSVSYQTVKRWLIDFDLLEVAS